MMNTSDEPLELDDSGNRRGMTERIPLKVLIEFRQRFLGHCIGTQV